MDAKSDERSFQDSIEVQEIELPLSFAVLELCQQIREGNALLLTLVQQNEQIVSLLLEDERTELASLDTDMEGNPIRVTSDA